MFQTVKNEKGFTLISSIAGAMMIVLSLGGLTVTMISTQKQMFERYFHRCAMLNASNYYHVIRYQVKKRTLTPSIVAGMRIQNTIGRYHMEHGDTDLNSSPTAMKDDDRYNEISGFTTANLVQRTEVIPGSSQANKYYELTVGTNWSIEEYDASNPEDGDPAVSKPESVFFIKGLVY